MDWPRAILHADMDAFYAAVEQMDRPELRGRPVLIGSDRPRGVVATASYEARPFGCRSAQPVAVAKRLCPDAVIVPPRMKRYREISDEVFEIFHQTSPSVQPLSIDEAFLDLTGMRRLLGPPERVAEELRARIHREVGLTASVGLAPNKFLAKLASEMDKPDGLTIVRPGEAQALLDPLPVGRLWGVGPATESRLHALGLRTVGQIRALSEDEITSRLGSLGEHLLRLSRGLDDRPVTHDSGAKSIGHECTFEEDIEEPEEVLRVMLTQSEQVGRRLRRHGVVAAGITVKIRYGNFETITRATTLDKPTDSTEPLWRAARELFQKWRRKAFQPVRLIGVTATRLSTGGSQLGLFPDPEEERRKRLDKALDRIQDRFGGSSIHRGG